MNVAILHFINGSRDNSIHGGSTTTKKWRVFRSPFRRVALHFLIPMPTSEIVNLPDGESYYKMKESGVTTGWEELKATAESL